jgi:NAD(P)-dependent dehydrogenase (short-subunit alcohol dehydrogenase family)
VSKTCSSLSKVVRISTRDGLLPVAGLADDGDVALALEQHSYTAYPGEDVYGFLVRVGGTVIVTGASSGIGEACALRLARGGFDVFAGVRKDEDAERADALHERIKPLKVDVSDEASVAAAAQEVGDGPIAGLVNNAGISVTGPLEFVPLDEFRRQLEVNVIGQIAATQAFLPGIRAARGRIVNIGSVGGKVAVPLLSPYAGSKFAMEGITDSLRRELRPLGVHVAIVEPGAIATEIWRKGTAAAEELLADAPPDSEAVYGKLIAAVRVEAAKATKRAIPPDEVAKVVEHALTADKPRARYPVGRDAKMRIRVAGLLSDRAFDALVARQLGG